MKTKLTCTALILFSLASCLTPTEKNDDNKYLTLEYNRIKKQETTSFFDFSKMKIIQLESKGEYFLSDNYEIQFFDNNYFVYDFVKNEFYRYDYDGKFLNTISNYGGSEEEYSNVSSFSIDEKKKMVEIMCNQSKYIKRYGYNGEFIDKYTIPIRGTGFTKGYNNDYWFYMVIEGNGQLSNRLHYVDSLETIQSSLPLKTNLMGAMEQNFFKSEDHILFRESFFPYIYKLAGGKAIPIIKFDFGESEITESVFEMEKDPFVFFDRINRTGFFTTTKVVYGDELLAVTCQYQKAGNKTKISGVFYDFKDENATLLEYSEEKVGELLSNSKLVRIDKDRFFYFIIDPITFQDYIKYVKTEIDDVYTPDENYIIFSIPLKN